MPLYGLIPDSPFIYAFQKLSHSSGSISSRASLPRMKLTVKFQGVTIYKPVLNYELNDPSSKLVGAYMRGLSKKIVIGAKSQVGHRTGTLRRSIHAEHYRISSAGQGFRVGSDVSYAYLHHEGTKPHLITPNPPNKVLRFSTGSRIVNTTLVRHPGTRANKYLSDQLRIHIR